MWNSSQRLPIILLAALLLLLCFSVGFFLMHAPAAPAPEAADAALKARLDDLQKQLADLKTRVDELTAEDVILADVEGPDYGDWTAAGTAFGKGPAHGTLENQNAVSGFLGGGLVNTYVGGNDAATGTLTSPPFKIKHRYLNFLIGGGDHPGTTCINLIVDGAVARTATGKNDEHLEWYTWNLSSLAGKTATLQIVDQETGGWGHINIDQITLSLSPK